jgi:hypothetical protein
VAVGEDARLDDWSTPDRYYVTDSALAGVHAHATVDDDGVLYIDLRAVTRSGVRSTVLLGKEQFERILAHFGEKVKAIKGNWRFGTNLALVNELTDRGMGLEEAARQTWTGRRAASVGFTDMVILRVEGSAGRYTGVQVLFRQPEVDSEGRGGAHAAVPPAP